MQRYSTASASLKQPSRKTSDVCQTSKLQRLPHLFTCGARRTKERAKRSTRQSRVSLSRHALVRPRTADDGTAQRARVPRTTTAMSDESDIALPRSTAKPSLVANNRGVTPEASKVLQDPRTRELLPFAGLAS